MLTAYNEGKDLYAMIARSAFNNNYEDNLEFYPEGTIVDIDGKKVTAGSEKEYDVKSDENDSISIKYYELLETADGDKSACDLNIGDKINSDIGILIIRNKKQEGNIVTLTLAH